MPHSLGQIKSFWQTQGVWPETGPHDGRVSRQYEGPAPNSLENAACRACETDVWTTDRGPVIAECDTGEFYGYCSHECYFENRTRNQLEDVLDEYSVFIP